METKLFEVRDRMTFVPVICIKLEPSNEADRYLLAMTGYGLVAEEQVQYILYSKLQGGEFTCVPEEHNVGARTHSVAHYHINEHWDELKSGDVIDIEFLVGETTTPKTSQRLQKIDGI